jgi:hypothetical protein
MVLQFIYIKNLPSEQRKNCLFEGANSRNESFLRWSVKGNQVFGMFAEKFANMFEPYTAFGMMFQTSRITGGFL